MTTTRPAGSPWSTSRASIRGKLGTYLMDKHGILVVTIDRHKDFQGIRVTPNVYATLDEIDTFGEAMQRAATKGIS